MRAGHPTVRDEDLGQQTLVICNFGEETPLAVAQTKHNAEALILPHKALLGFNGGAIGVTTTATATTSSSANALPPRYSSHVTQAS